MSKEHVIGWIKFWKPTDFWYQLSNEKRKEYINNYQLLTSTVIDKGASLIGSYKCRGQSEWERFEVWEFPDLEVLIEFTDELETINHYLYFSSDHLFGQKYKQVLKPDTWEV